jgi:acyl-CoA thioester hydrolase
MFGIDPEPCHSGDILRAILRLDLSDYLFIFHLQADYNKYAIINIMKTHETKIVVRYSETDQMGRVYYSRYLEWFELARAEHFKSIGHPYSEMEKTGVYLVVSDTYIKYLKPAKYEETITVKTTIKEISKASIVFEYEVKEERSEALLATGYSTLVSINKEGRVTKAPEIFKKLNI